jgi:hypothetical protein
MRAGMRETASPRVLFIGLELQLRILAVGASDRALSKSRFIPSRTSEYIFIALSTRRSYCQQI